MSSQTQTDTRSHISYVWCLARLPHPNEIWEKWRRNKQKKIFESTYFDAFLLPFTSLTIFCDVVRYLNTQMTEQSLIVWSEFKYVPREEKRTKEKMIMYVLLSVRDGWQWQCVHCLCRRSLLCRCRAIVKRVGTYLLDDVDRNGAKSKRI